MQYFLIVILIALSAFFSGSEISYASLNGMRMKTPPKTAGLPQKRLIASIRPMIPRLLRS